MTTPFGIETGDALDPLVLALDVGSTASRGAIYDATGRPVGRRAKIPHAFATASDGACVIDPDQVVTELTGIIGELAAAVGDRVIAGVALDTFASSLIALDDDGDPLTTCFTYADGRCAAQVEELRAEASEEDLQQLTGTRIHSSYWPARLRWLRQTQPEVTGSAAHYVSLGDYVLLRLTGRLVTGTASAAWTGMVDRRRAGWSDGAIGLAGIRRGQLPRIHHLDQPVDPKKKHARAIAAAWPALAGAVWFAPIADGLAANVGLGALDETVIGGSCATSGALRVLVRDLPERLPAGLWCYRVSHDRALVGGAMNDVGRVLAWAGETLAVGDEAAQAAALAGPPQATTPLTLPFLTGERSTGWASRASAVVTGITGASSAASLYRGVAEGVALGYRRIAAQLHEVAPHAGALRVGGRVAVDHPELLQLMADAMGTRVTPVTIKRSTLHGTALLALETLAPGVQRADVETGPALEPVPGHATHYAARAEEFERAYRALFTSGLTAAGTLRA